MGKLRFLWGPRDIEAYELGLLSFAVVDTDDRRALELGDRILLQTVWSASDAMGDYCCGSRL